MTLSTNDVRELTEFRRELHQYPELSGNEVETAQRIVDALTPLSPNRVVTELGGHGVAAVFDSGVAGPTVLFRAELDALPIQEISDNPWVSKVPGHGHLCGHDGHMTMLLALGRMLAERPTAVGRVVLMFQPSEEDGRGARAVVADKKFEDLRPDYAFAIHVEPGRPFGFVSTRVGLMNCASQGLAISFVGKTAHAACPQEGVSPAMCIAQLIPALNTLSLADELNDQFRLVTVTHVQMGEPTFGIAPGEARLLVTLRTATDEALHALDEAARNLSRDLAEQAGLSLCFDVCDAFAATVNDAEATDMAVKAMNALGISCDDSGLPMRASEDFGVFGWDARAAILCLGPGERYAGLHNPDYDFPDALIPVGASIFERITRDLLGTRG